MDDVDAPEIVALITEAALCADCIARKTGLTVTRVDEMLVRIRTTVAVTSTVANCDACLRQTVVHRLG